MYSSQSSVEENTENSKLNYYDASISKRIVANNPKYGENPSEQPEFNPKEALTTRRRKVIRQSKAFGSIDTRHLPCSTIQACQLFNTDQKNQCRWHELDLTSERGCAANDQQDLTDHHKISNQDVRKEVAKKQSKLTAKQLSSKALFSFL